MSGVLLDAVRGGGLAPCVMVLGTSSGAGKSWVATALCRFFARQGLRVAPFKAQNMSNNARVVPGPGGVLGEMGSAQYFQALAAAVAPDVRMNPLLLKPEADSRSQVVLWGQHSAALSALPWRERGPRVWPDVARALDGLRAEFDVVVIEGAGSPAEINLYDSDVVNLRVARHAGARCVLVADVDRGGAFAHLYGTWALLPEADRSLIHGFVLNKFRGNAALLAPAPQLLQERTGVPTLAVLPLLRSHGLPEEDSVFDDRPVFQAENAGSASVADFSSYQNNIDSGLVPRQVAVVAYPRMSNLDEFQPLKNVPGLRLVWARAPADLVGADTIILPGSKATAADLAWLRAQGLDAAIARHAGAGGRVLGICAGLQMLGEALIDLHGVESAGAAGNGPGLGLLPLVTSFAPQKTLRHTRAAFGPVAGAWGALAHVAFSGYEIHCGQTAQHPAMAAKGDVARCLIEGLAWQNPAGNVLGLYAHGLFEDPATLRALWGARAPTLEAVFDRLADTLAAGFAPGALASLLG